MLIPTRIHYIYERVPVATYTLVGLNILGFIWSTVAGGDDYGGWWLNPRDLNPLQFLTSMFLHGGFLHLVGNMLFLVVYGRYVEDRLGPWRYLGLYLLCGLAGDFLYLAIGNEAPSLGASGAIAGLMGFVFFAAPWNDVDVIWLIHPAQFAAQDFDGRMKLPAWWLLIIWLVFQALIGWIGGSNIAVSAHLGGFAAGYGIAAWMRHGVEEGTAWYLEPDNAGGGPAATRRLQKARVVGRRTQLQPDVPLWVVTFESLEPEASGVAVVKLLMKRLQQSPEEAKAIVDELRSGTTRSFDFEEEAPARRLHEEAAELDVTTRLTEPPAAAVTTPEARPAPKQAPVGDARASAPDPDEPLPPIDF